MPPTKSTSAMRAWGQSIRSDIRPILGRFAYRALFVFLQLVTGGLALRTRLGIGDGKSRPHLDYELRVVRSRRMTPWSRARLRLWLAAAHGWRTRYAPFDWYVRARSTGRDITVAGIVDRYGEWDGEPVRVAILGGVLTRPEFRKRGLATTVVKEAMTVMESELPAEFGVLTCTDKLVPFYERLGWQVHEDDMVFTRFGENHAAASNVMVYQCGDQEPPSGPLDLHGLPA